MLRKSYSSELDPGSSGFKPKPDNGFDMTPEARRPQGSANAARWNCQVETLGRFSGLKWPPRL